MIAILDCGTTNTKCYLVKTDGTFLHEKYCGFGVKENALDSGRELYKKKLKQMVDDTMLEAGIRSGQLEAVIAFGMISSDLGIKVLPHIPTPAGLEELKKGIYLVDEDAVFGPKVKFYIIRGIKNNLEQERAVKNIEICDFMRGEETQVMGILEKYHPGTAFNAVVFSSHFKIIHVSKEGKILQSMTTMSGQIFDCMLNHTVVGKSVCAEEDPEIHMSIEEIIALAEQITAARGMNRALLCPRFMELFTEMTAMERLLYLDAVIGLEDLKAMREYYPDGPYETKKYYFVGQKKRCQLFEKILKSVWPGAEVEILDGKEKNREISIAGVLQLMSL